MAAPQKGLRNAASALVRRKGLLLPALLLAVAAAALATVFAHRAALADALLAQLQATSAQRGAPSTAGQVSALAHCCGGGTYMDACRAIVWQVSVV